MTKISKQLLESNNSYIEALKSAINTWNAAKTMTDKRDYILVIGEIGNAIHKQNLASDIRHMEVED